MNELKFSKQPNRPRYVYVEELIQVCLLAQSLYCFFSFMLSQSEGRKTTIHHIESHIHYLTAQVSLQLPADQFADDISFFIDWQMLLLYY